MQQTLDLTFILMVPLLHNYYPIEKYIHYTWDKLLFEKRNYGLDFWEILILVILECYTLQLQGRALPISNHATSQTKSKVGTTMCQTWTTLAGKTDCSNARHEEGHLISHAHSSQRTDFGCPSSITRFCHRHLTWVRQQQRLLLERFLSSVLVLTDAAACSRFPRIIKTKKVFGSFLYVFWLLPRNSSFGVLTGQDIHRTQWQLKQHHCNYQQQQELWFPLAVWQEWLT